MVANNAVKFLVAFSCHLSARTGKYSPLGRLEILANPARSQTLDVKEGLSVSYPIVRQVSRSVSHVLLCVRPTELVLQALAG